MRSFWQLWILAFAALVAGCSGGSNGGSLGAGTGGSSGGTAATCSLRERQNWASATLNEWYLFPETLPASLDPAPYATVDAYIDALTATARGQRRDRFFTFITSIAEENAFINSGSSAGLGIRLSTDTAARRVFVIEAFEGTAALAAGIDRGTEILAIGTTSAALRPVSDIIAADPDFGITDALGPTTAGTTRTLQITDAGGPRVVTVTKTDYTLTPVSARYGSKIIDDGGRRVGYINLRTFIQTADTPLRNAIGQFRAAGITNIIVDFRYNGGGLLSTADLMGDLLGGNRSTLEIFAQETYRPEKAANNSVKRFAPTAQSASPVRLAFIGTDATASASELVINGFTPFFGANSALIGTNTFGKPVGQIAVDRAVCDDRLRVVAFAAQNGAGQANYFDGLAGAVGASCRATDDFTKPLGDPQEASVRQALDYLAGQSCVAIPVGGQTGQSVALRGPQLLRPAAPTVAQREVPGLF
ncbi:MAG: S41 family peptidase [Sphingomonadaceae bacterium]